MAAANKTRGEVSITLDGVDYVMRPSHDAIAAFQLETGKGILRLAQDAMRADMASQDAAVIITECLKAQGRAIGDEGMARFNSDRIHGLMMEAVGGYVAVLHSLGAMLAMASTGGFTASGELKAPVEKKKATPTGA